MATIKYSSPANQFLAVPSIPWKSWPSPVGYKSSEASKSIPVTSSYFLFLSWSTSSWGSATAEIWGSGKWDAHGDRLLCSRVCSICLHSWSLETCGGCRSSCLSPSSSNTRCWGHQNLFYCQYLFKWIFLQAGFIPVSWIDPSGFIPNPASEASGSQILPHPQIAHSGARQRS